MARKKPSRKTVLPTFSDIDKMSYAEVRATYSNLRSIFNKRVKRAVKYGISAAGEYSEGGAFFFPKLKQRFISKGERGLSQDDQKLALQYNIKELVNLLKGGYAAEPISITQVKQRERELMSKMIGKLHYAGYEHIQKSTLKNFGHFMDAMRKQYGLRLPQSETMAEFFESLKYDTKRRSTQFIVDLWREFEANGYQPDDGNQDLFAT